MRYLSVCSGIEAASVAWKPLGWECVGVAEIEKFPSAVLAQRYPNVPNLGDLTKYQEWPRDLAPDLIVGGTPCQSFSVAGLRAGLADPRGNLALVFLGLVDQYRPRYVVWENVPGVRSSGGGRDFGAFLGALGELGYGWAYRSLDAQYFGLAQRRERVFVVGCLGDWRASAAVLLESESLRGDSAPRRASREDLATTLAARTRSGSGYGPDTETPVIAFAPEVAAALETTCHDYSRADGFNMIAHNASIAPTLAASGVGAGRTGNERTEADFLVAHSLRAEGFDASEDGTGRGTPLVPMSVALRGREGGATAEMGDEVAFALRATSGGGDKPHVIAPVAFVYQAGGTQTTLGYDPASGTTPTLPKSQTLAVAFGENLRGEVRTMEVFSALSSGGGKPGQGYPAVLAPSLTASNDPSRSPQSSEITQQVAAVHAATMAVRRLTPRECERLQGFPDDYTLIPYRNGMSADGPRYKALGNSMAVPVMAWIGRRIAAVDALLVELQRQEAA